MTSAGSKNRTVCIIGVGAATAVGANALSSAAAIRAGISIFTEHPYMIDGDGERMIVARASYLPDEARGEERLLQLALPAAQEALAPLHGLKGKLPAIPVVIGLPAKRPGLAENLDNRLAVRFKTAISEHGAVSSVETIPTGHSAGLMALETGYRKIQSGNSEFCLVGGVDSYLEPETLEWLEECDQLHNSTNAWGFVPGEAAGFCLLTSTQAAGGLDLSVLANVIAVATARETNLIKTETVCIGQGLSNAFNQVLSALPSPDARIDQIICDMNGEAYRAEEYGFTIARTSEYFVDATDFQSPADCWGDVGAASGPLFGNLAIVAGLKGYSKGPHTLVWASSEGGERSAGIIYTNII